jgi:transcriptional regulator with XRE-family HTH domain
MTQNFGQPRLGEALRAERRKRRLSLRDLADEIGVGFNTLSRFERGHVPEMKNYDRIVKWLGSPGQPLFEDGRTVSSTPALIAKHIYSDSRLKPEAANEMMTLVQEMYAKLAAPKPAFAVHLRSSQTFLPEVGGLLAGALQDMQSALVDEAQ